MNVWTALPRLLVSSRCPHNARFLVEESLLNSIRHYSTNTPVSTKPPEVSSNTHFSDLVKEALARADSKTHTQHSAPRLHITSDGSTISASPFKNVKKASKGKRRRGKRSKEEKKAASKNNTDSKKSKKPKSPELTAEPIPKQDAGDQLTPEEERIRNEQMLQNLNKSLSAFPTEKWATEPWWVNQQNDDQPEDLDRSSPPHILQHVVMSEGTLNPSVTSSLVDVPTLVEHLPVARLCHGLERVLFKYVIYLLPDFLRVDRFAALVSIGCETRIRGCITSLLG